jgi:hypothetical protein
MQYRQADLTNIFQTTRAGAWPVFCVADVLGLVPGVDVMAKRPQGLLNVGTLSARMAVLRSCALDI